MSCSRGRINTWPLCLEYKRGKGDEMSLTVRVCLHRGECLPYVTTTTRLTWSLLIILTSTESMVRVDSKLAISRWKREDRFLLRAYDYVLIPFLGLNNLLEDITSSYWSVEPANKHRCFSLANWSPPYWKSRMSKASWRQAKKSSGEAPPMKQWGKVRLNIPRNKESLFLIVEKFFDNFFSNKSIGK